MDDLDLRAPQKSLLETYDHTLHKLGKKIYNCNDFLRFGVID